MQAETALDPPKLVHRLPTISELIWPPPQAIVGKLNAAVVDALASKVVERRLTDLGQEVSARDQQSAAALVILQLAEIKRWWPIVRGNEFASEVGLQRLANFFGATFAAGHIGSLAGQVACPRLGLPAFAQASRGLGHVLINLGSARARPTVERVWLPFLVAHARRFLHQHETPRLIKAPGQGVALERPKQELIKFALRDR